MFRSVLLNWSFANSANPVNDLINDNIYGRWSIGWILDSPRSTVCDVIFWGHLKEHVYTHSLTNYEVLNKLFKRNFFRYHTVLFSMRTVMIFKYMFLGPQSVVYIQVCSFERSALTLQHTKTSKILHFLPFCQ